MELKKGNTSIRIKFEEVVTEEQAQINQSRLDDAVWAMYEESEQEAV